MIYIYIAAIGVPYYISYYVSRNIKSLFLSITVSIVFGLLLAIIVELTIGYILNSINKEIFPPLDMIIQPIKNGLLSLTSVGFGIFFGRRKFAEKLLIEKNVLIRPKPPNFYVKHIGLVVTIAVGFTVYFVGNTQQSAYIPQVAPKFGGYDGDRRLDPASQNPFPQVPKRIVEPLEVQESQRFSQRNEIGRNPTMQQIMDANYPKIPGAAKRIETDKSSSRIEYWSEVRKNVAECTRNKDFSTITCWIKSTPSKCEFLIYDAFLGSKKKRPLIFCIRSCSDAGFFSRTFGECSRDID